MAHNAISATSIEIDDARRAAGLSWQDVADHLGVPLVWAVAALLGSHPVPAATATAAGELLSLSDDAVADLQRQPYRVADPEISSDPTIYRLLELVNVYGPAIKALIHDEFGDGIMSAINCNVAFERRSDPNGDRVVLTIDGKFLPYQW